MATKLNLNKPKTKIEVENNQDIDTVSVKFKNNGIDLVLSMNIVQAEDLCEKLEKSLYDDPTYKELENKYYKVLSRLKNLKERLESQTGETEYYAEIE